jgi:penicillin-binding protein 2
MFENNFLDITVRKNDKTPIFNLYPNKDLDLVVQTGFKIPAQITNFIQIFVLLILCLFVLRLGLIQVYTANVWQEWSYNTTTQTVYVLAPRGRILDRFGKIMVGNKPSFKLVTSSKNLQNTKRADEIQKVLDIDDVELDTRVKRGVQGSVELASDLNKEDMLKIAMVAENLNIDILPQYQRYYVQDVADESQRQNFGKTVGSIVGYTGLATPEDLKSLDKNLYRPDSQVGITGLEKYYESLLQGIPGKIQRTSRLGLDTDSNQKTVQDVSTGQDLQVGIDLDLQLKLNSIVQEEFKNYDMKAGAVVLMSADTGQIRSLINFPTYNPEVFVDKKMQTELTKYFTDAERPLFNRTTRGQYPPGSSLKPFVAAVGLQEKIITPEQQILDAGVVRVKSKVVDNRVDEYINFKRIPYGKIDVSDALGKSSDVFFYYLTGGDPETGRVPTLSGKQNQALGIDKLKTGLQKYFGFGETPTGDFDFLSRGIIPDPAYKQKILKSSTENWFLGDTYQTSIGQGYVLATPLQLARATAVIANGGYIVSPSLDINSSKTPTQSGLNKDTLETLDQSMRQVVTSGTAKRMLENDLTLAAKTGTAQFDPNNPERAHGFVISYNQDMTITKEKLVMIVLTEDIDKTAEFITVPIATRLWQEVSQHYKNLKF